MQAIDGLRVHYWLEMPARQFLLPLDDLQWADWHPMGRVLAATRSGRLQVRTLAGSVMSIEVDHDLSALEPAPTPAPDWAGQW
ncbi:MAG: hypothetical protein R2712_26205 [Vicinamibacterales bacterium]